MADHDFVSGAHWHIDWAFASREKLPPFTEREAPAQQDGAIVQVVPSGPDVTDDELFEGILSFIFSAKQRLWIVTPYFLPNEMLAEALEIAVERGVDVRIVVPERSDQRLVDLARGQYLRDLCALKCQILLYVPGMIHAKAMLVDDVAAAVCSANFDSRSMFLNFEVSSVIHTSTESAPWKFRWKKSWRGRVLWMAKSVPSAIPLSE